MYLIMTKAVKHRRIISIAIMTIFAVMTLIGTVAADEIDSINQALKKLSGQIRAIGFTMCIVCSVYVGILFMMSGVNPKLRDQAKYGLWGIAIGVIVLVMSDNMAKIVADLIGKGNEVQTTN